MALVRMISRRPFVVPLVVKKCLSTQLGPSYFDIFIIQVTTKCYFSETKVNKSLVLVWWTPRGKTSDFHRLSECYCCYYHHYYSPATLKVNAVEVFYYTAFATAATKRYLQMVVFRCVIHIKHNRDQSIVYFYCFIQNRGKGISSSKITVIE